MNDRVTGAGQAADQDQSTPHLLGSGGAERLQPTELVEEDNELANQSIEQFHFHSVQIVNKGLDSNKTAEAVANDYVTHLHVF